MRTFTTSSFPKGGRDCVRSLFDLVLADYGNQTWEHAVRRYAIESLTKPLVKDLNTHETRSSSTQQDPKHGAHSKVLCDCIAKATDQAKDKKVNTATNHSKSTEHQKAAPSPMGPPPAFGFTTTKPSTSADPSMIASS